MEENNFYDELLLKFLTDQLNPDEETKLFTWIDEDVANRQYFEEFKATWQLALAKESLNKIDVDEEWKYFGQKVGQPGNHYDPELVDFETSVDRRSKVYRLLTRVSVAAAVLLLIGFGWKLLNKTTPTQPGESIVKENKIQPKDTLLAIVRHEVNNTGRDKQVQLQDGSLIIISPRSEVSFHEPFGDKREITLKGKAYFKVAKDPSRPFTVFSGDISTTALGTEFVVTAFENSDRITVRLYEGKVVVKPVEKENRKIKNEVFLIPGQVFVYDTRVTAKVEKFNLKQTVSPEERLHEALEQDNPSLPQNTRGSWFMFNNQSLAQVLNHLGEVYNVKIDYIKEELDDIYFTGKYYETDSLSVILNQISILNNLTVTKTEKGFLIRK